LPTTSSNCCADHLLGDNRFFCNELRRQVDGGIRRPQLPDLGLSKLLVIAQVSLSLVLLIGAGLVIESIERILAIDRGFEPGTSGSPHLICRSSTIRRLAPGCFSSNCKSDWQWSPAFNPSACRKHTRRETGATAGRFSMRVRSLLRRSCDEEVISDFGCIRTRFRPGTFALWEFPSFKAAISARGIPRVHRWWRSLPRSLQRGSGPAKIRSASASPCLLTKVRVVRPFR